MSDFDCFFEFISDDKKDQAAWSKWRDQKKGQSALGPGLNSLVLSMFSNLV